MRPWSKSKLDVAAACPLRFHLQYVEKAKGARVERGEGRIGRAAHQALEALLKGPATNISELLEIEAEKEELTSVEREELVCLGDEVLFFIERFEAWKLRHRVQPADVYIERRLAIRENFTKTRFWDNQNGMLRGVVDLMVRVPKTDGVDVVIIDHKTGRSNDLKYHDDQMRMYAIMADANISGVRNVRLAMHFLRRKEIKWFSPIPVEVIRAEYRPWLLQKIQQAEADVRAWTTFDANPGWGCDYCAYQHQCPAK